MKLPILPALALLATPAFAVVNIDHVTAGHAGNVADPATGSLYGAVAYAYKIGRYEVTNAQYTEFLNAVAPTGANANGIYNTNMGSNSRGGIAYTAGAASGSTETGAYTLSGKHRPHHQERGSHGLAAQRGRVV